MKKTLLGLGILAVSLSASAQNRKSAIEWPSYSTIISEQPEGENITDVIGKNFAYTYEQNQMMRQQTYNGVASYVKGTDGNIYIYNPVPGYRAGSYLKLEPTSDGRYVAHTPQAIGYDSYYGREVRFYLHSKDVDGNPIDADGLSYRVYVGADSVYTFTPDKYTRLEAPMSLVAYSFSDQYDFPAAANDYHRFYFYEDELDALGLQSVYTAGGVTNVSEITWWKEPVGTSVSGLDADVKPVRTDWFDMQGRRVDSPSKGVYVVRKTMPDGSVITSKHVNR